MKRIFRLVLLLSAVINLSCSFSSANNEKKDTDKNTSNKENNTMTSNIETAKDKVLVVYFSHAGENYSVGSIEVGNTKIVADYICDYIGCKQFEIVALKDYNMSYNKLIELAKDEAKKGELPEFKGEIKDIDQYSTIFIGGPVWWGTYPQVMFTFFKTYDLNGKTIVPFTTHEGSGLASCVEDVKKAYPEADVKKGFAIYGHQVRSSKQKVIDWLKDLGF